MTYSYNYKGIFGFVDLESVVKLKEGEFTNGVAGTRGFMSPEMEEERDYNHKTGFNDNSSFLCRKNFLMIVDIYSLGATFVYLFECNKNEWSEELKVLYHNCCCRV